MQQIVILGGGAAGMAAALAAAQAAAEAAAGFDKQIQRTDIFQTNNKRI